MNFYCNTPIYRKHSIFWQRKIGMAFLVFVHSIFFNTHHFRKRIRELIIIGRKSINNSISRNNFNIIRTCREIYAGCIIAASQFSIINNCSPRKLKAQRRR